MTERPPPRCPRCGAEVVTYGHPDSQYFTAPRYCTNCAAPLTAEAKADREVLQSSILNALEAEMAERVIDRGAVVLEIDPYVARRVVIKWAKRQP
jgi:ribosomal protein S27AE